jgi:NADH-quinone oxidoreductase subunit I
MDVLKQILSGFWNLLVGLFTTGKRLPKPAVTLQYPDEKWTMPERSRGVVVLLTDPETGELNCNACQVCMKQCPVSAITVTQMKDEKGERHPDIFTIDNTICCFCGICEEVCNFDAIKLTGKYEFATFTKADLIYDKAKLQALGRDVQYEKKRKPKPAPRPPATPAAEAPKESKQDNSAEEKA